MGGGAVNGLDAFEREIELSCRSAESGARATAKRAVMWLYCHGVLSIPVTTWLFCLLRLRGA